MWSVGECRKVVCASLVPRTFWAVTLLAILCAAGQARSQTVSRTVSITIDDLPAVNAMGMNAAQITAMNTRLIAALKAEKLPVIGFVNEERLYKLGEVDARIGVLSAWLDAGFDLGNHTFSHTSLNQVELKDWQDDVVQGESVSRMLLKSHGKRLEYIREPYLDAGPDLATRRQAEAFLSGRGYRIAPVTMDALDWFFSDLYAAARQKRDDADQRKIVQAWLAYTADMLAFDEGRSRTLLGYEPKQVLLLHDTWMEADHIADLLALLKGRGYQFVALGDALKDAAYAQPDEYISDVGATSLTHWAVTRGRLDLLLGRPAVPGWVRERHQALGLDSAR